MYRKIGGKSLLLAPSAVFVKLASFACNCVNPAGTHKRKNLKRDCTLKPREVVVRAGGTTTVDDGDIFDDDETDKLARVVKEKEGVKKESEAAPAAGKACCGVKYYWNSCSGGKGGQYGRD